MPTSNTKKIVIVAGEESGDRHAADLIRELNLTHPAIEFSGIGGQHMRSAGVELISDLARFGVTGLTEVFKYFWIIRRAFKSIEAHLIKTKPDLLILVDYPGFNLRLARIAKKLNIRVLYFISPQIWAWKAGRIKTIQHCVDRMAVILPFEKEIYEKANVPVTFVGHPLVHDVKTCVNQEETRLQLGLPIHQRIVAMLPGSRTNEIEHHMPVLIETAKRLLQIDHKLCFAIPVAATINPESLKAYFKESGLPITLIQSKAVEVAGCSDCAIVASGTASLECALLEKPMCIIYKGSRLSYFIACMVIKVKYLGLCNLLQNRMIVPELLQYDCNPHELTRVASKLLDNASFSQSIIKELQQLKHSLSSEQADMSISRLVATEIGFNSTHDQ